MTLEDAEKEIPRLDATIQEILHQSLNPVWSLAQPVLPKQVLVTPKREHWVVLMIHYEGGPLEVHSQWDDEAAAIQAATYAIQVEGLPGVFVTRVMLNAYVAR